MVVVVHAFNGGRQVLNWEGFSTKWFGEALADPTITEPLKNSPLVVGMGEDLEEASYDLGAGRLSTFRQVTLPRLTPAILAGGLLAFTFSFDDFITSFFVSGAGATTLAAIVVAYLVLRRTAQGRRGATGLPGV